MAAYHGVRTETRNAQNNGASKQFKRKRRMRNKRIGEVQVVLLIREVGEISSRFVLVSELLKGVYYVRRQAGAE